MMAGDLGIDLSVISNYHGAKDPDELIQKDPKLWQQAVEERVPAVDWLLAKYEENLNLRLAPDKKKYSDVALKLLSYVKDEIERATYEKKVADKLGIEVKILREKGERLDEKLKEKSTRKFYKKPKTAVVPDHIKKMEDSLLALKVFGGITKTDIPLEVPEDETRLNELEMIFNNDHENIQNPDYESEAAEMFARYKTELDKQKIAALKEKLAELDEESEEYAKVLSEVDNFIRREG